MRKLEFHRLEYFPPIAQSRQSSIAQPVVRSNNASPFNHFLDKASKAFCRSVRHMFEANPPNSIRRLILDSDDYQSLPFCPSTSLATFASTNVGFVHLNTPRKSVSSWSNHSPSELVQPLPGRLVAAWLNDSSKAKSVGTVFLRCDVPHRAKPQPQRLASTMENCPGRYRGLRAAVPTMPQPALRPPGLVCSTLWAYKATRPTQRSQILQASGFTREPFLKLCQGARIILHVMILHIVATGVNPIPP